MSEEIQPPYNPTGYDLNAQEGIDKMQQWIRVMTKYPVPEYGISAVMIQRERAVRQETVQEVLDQIVLYYDLDLKKHPEGWNQALDSLQIQKDRILEKYQLREKE